MDEHKTPDHPEFYLEVMFGTESGKRYALDTDRSVVGRGEEADFILDDGAVSRKHVELRHVDGNLVLKDLGSGNGTRVNGEKVPEAVLGDSDTVEIGATIMMVKAGPLPQAHAAGRKLRLRDTQELPVIEPGKVGGPAIDPGGTHPPVAMRRSSRRKGRVPSPFMAQVVSWLVVAVLTMGGVLLALTVMDSGELVTRAGDDDGDFRKRISAPRQSKAAPLFTREKPKRRESLLAELPMEAAPDVALEKYNEAVKAQDAGDLEGALRILEDVAERYPEFHAPGDTSVIERMNRLEKRIAHAGTIRWGNEVLAQERPTVDRLQNILVELDAIPSTDAEYGDQAMELSVRVKERLSLFSGEDAGVTSGLNDASSDTEVVSGPLPDAEVVAPEETPESPIAENPDAAALAAQNAIDGSRNLYRDGAFGRAARYLRDRADNMEAPASQAKVERAAARMEAFGKHYERGVKLSRKALQEKEAITEMGQARKLDGQLFGLYKERIDKQMALLHTALAERSLEADRFSDARKHLDQARRADAGARDVAKLENLFAFRAAALLRQARKEATPDAGLRLVEQALQLAEEGSATESEANALRKELSKTLDKKK